MNKKLLTSVLAVCSVCPVLAGATPTNTSNVFPTESPWMQPDYRYTNAAIDTNMAGVYKNNGTVYAIAQWLASPGYYDSGSGQSLCPAGSYCDGTSQSSCGTGWTSDLGTSDQSWCYMECPSVEGAHQTGQYYYTTTTPNVGSGKDTCTIVSCDHGYTLQQSGTAAETGYNPPESIGERVGIAYIPSTGVYTQSDHSVSFPQSVSKIYAPNTFAYLSDGVHGVITGRAKCVNVSKEGFVASLDGESLGSICYCKFETNAQGNKIPANWLKYESKSSVDACQADCARNCANAVAGAGSSAFKEAMAGSGRVFGSCVANTIHIQWQTGTDGATMLQTSVTYGKNIDTPSEGPTKTGKTFLGWRFSSSEPSSN